METNLKDAVSPPSALAGLRVLDLTDYLCDRAPTFGLEVFSSRAAGDKSGIVSLATPGREPKDVFKRCKAAGVIVNVRAGRVRDRAAGGRATGLV